jgi:4-hydroxyphenylacetate 3-monooxygenase
MRTFFIKEGIWLVGKSRGQRYIDSLQDGRSVWLDGKRIENLSRHPAFKGTLQTLSTLMNTLDQVETRDQVGFVSPKTGEYVHQAFLVPHSAEDLLKRKKAFSLWASLTHGVMSRLSEYARSLVTGWYAARSDFERFDPTFSDKITKYYEEARDGDRLITTAILDPQIDRSKSIYEQRDPDFLLRVVKETSEGVVVRGAKMIATAAPYTHDVIVLPYQRLKDGDQEYANMFIVPLNLPGLHIVCRESFASEKQKEHPLSARYDEMDAVLLFDDVLIPWERVLIRGNAEGVFQAHFHQQTNGLANHQTVVRLLEKLEFVTGIGFAVAEAIGANRFLHVQEKLGELITQVESIRALLTASELQAQVDRFGVWQPAKASLQTARNLGTRYYPRALEILQQICAGGLIQLPSTSVEDSGEIEPLVRKYYQGANVDAEEKVKLFQLAWDLVGSPLGSRHELYERFYTGDPVRMFAFQYEQYDRAFLHQRMKDFYRLYEEGRKKDVVRAALSGAAK